MCRRFKINRESSSIQELCYFSLRIPRSLDVRVNDEADGIIWHDQKPALSLLRFGFPFDSDSFLYNARIETANEKKAFSAYLKNRIVFPCTSFFEKGKDDMEHEFIREDSSLCYLAGFYNDQNRFVLLTEKADHRLSSYHPRMPVLLKREDVIPYLSQKTCLLSLVSRNRPSVYEKGSYQQLSLF